MFKTSVRPKDLANLLSHAPDGIEYLSIDCFDTLIWRNIHAPSDIFAGLPVDLGERISAEQEARTLASHTNGSREVTLEGIYETLAPHASTAERDGMVAAELAAEARHCFAFGPAIELIAAARQRGLKVVMISDTYLNETRLRALMEYVAGKHVLDMIDHIFCSCDHGTGKYYGLFKPVLEKLGIAPAQMLHVGDNPYADLKAPSELGIPCVLLQQFDETSKDRLRLEAASACVMEPETGLTFPTYQPHRPQIALRTNDDPAFVLGHDVLGPPLYAFARWLREEAEEIERVQGKPVKLLFLLRDGHLPARTFAAMFPEWADRAIEVEISRFTAAAASFTDKAAIDRFLLPQLPTGTEDPRAFLSDLQNAQTFSHQFLFTDEECGHLARCDTPDAFKAEIQKPQTVEKIVARSGQFAERLVAHLRSQGIEDGDAVMIVDLGYMGSVQSLIEPLLRSAMNLSVSGRYMLLRETLRSGLDKKGFFDKRNYDVKALGALYSYIIVLEQFCTTWLGSVVNYAEDGTPVRRDNRIASHQRNCRDQVQDACLAYTRVARQQEPMRARSDDLDARRHAAIASLARLFFLPSAAEVEILKDFQVDRNLGTDVLTRMIDAEAAEEGLRRRGIFYLKSMDRMYLPGELQSQGVASTMLRFNAARFGFSLLKTDFDTTTMTIPLTIVDGQRQMADSVEAYPTSDGYYRAVVPVGTGRFSIALRLGELFEYVQFEELAFLPMTEFVGAQRDEALLAARPATDGMVELPKGLFHIERRDAFMLVPPIPSAEPMVLSIVLRPVVLRDAADVGETVLAA